MNRTNRGYKQTPVSLHIPRVSTIVFLSLLSAVNTVTSLCCQMLMVTEPDVPHVIIYEKSGLFRANRPVYVRQNAADDITTKYLYSCNHGWVYGQILPYYGICQGSFSADRCPESLPRTSITSYGKLIVNITCVDSVFPTRCPKGWVFFDDGCYKAICKPKNRTKAQTACLKHGATLTRIDSDYQNNFVRMLVTNSPSWIGATNYRSIWQWDQLENGCTRGYCTPAITAPRNTFLGELEAYNQFSLSSSLQRQNSCAALGGCSSEDTSWLTKQDGVECSQKLPFVCRLNRTSNIGYWSKAHEWEDGITSSVYSICSITSTAASAFSDEQCASETSISDAYIFLIAAGSTSVLLLAGIFIRALCLCRSSHAVGPAPGPSLVPPLYSPTDPNTGVNTAALALHVNSLAEDSVHNGGAPDRSGFSRIGSRNSSNLTDGRPRALVVNPIMHSIPKTNTNIEFDRENSSNHYKPSAFDMDGLSNDRIMETSMRSQRTPIQPDPMETTASAQQPAQQKATQLTMESSQIMESLQRHLTKYVPPDEVDQLIESILNNDSTPDEAALSFAKIISTNPSPSQLSQLSPSPSPRTTRSIVTPVQLRPNPNPNLNPIPSPSLYVSPSPRCSPTSSPFPPRRETIDLSATRNLESLLDTIQPSAPTSSFARRRESIDLSATRSIVSRRDHDNDSDEDPTRSVTVEQDPTYIHPPPSTNPQLTEEEYQAFMDEMYSEF